MRWRRARRGGYRPRGRYPDGADGSRSAGQGPRRCRRPPRSSGSRGRRYWCWRWSLFDGTDLSWWWFALLLLARTSSWSAISPTRPTGASVYNLGHTLVWPALLLAWGLPTDRPWVIAVGAIWMAHIGLDRALGYGLKLPDGFHHTHLGRASASGARST